LTRCKKSCNSCWLSNRTEVPIKNSSSSQSVSAINTSIDFSPSSVKDILSGAPTPCQDDATYRSPYGFACHVYSANSCSAMSEVGFIRSEVEELLTRCKKSCNTCWLSEVPSSFPSTVIPSDKPSLVPTNLPTLLPSNSPSNLPNDSPSTLPTFQLSVEPTRSFKFPSAEPSFKPSVYTVSSFFPSSIQKKKTSQSSQCLDNPSFTDKFGLSCAFYKHVNCTGVHHIGLSESEVEELKNSCPESCHTECTKDKTEFIHLDVNHETDMPCEDDLLFRNRFGLSCGEHSDLECDLLVDIGFTQEETKEIIQKCRFSCKRCSKRNNADYFKNQNLEQNNSTEESYIMARDRESDLESWKVSENNIYTDSYEVQNDGEANDKLNTNMLMTTSEDKTYNPEKEQKMKSALNSLIIGLSVAAIVIACSFYVLRNFKKISNVLRNFKKRMPECDTIFLGNQDGKFIFCFVYNEKITLS